MNEVAGSLTVGFLIGFVVGIVFAGNLDMSSESFEKAKVLCNGELEDIDGWLEFTCKNGLKGNLKDFKEGE